MTDTPPTTTTATPAPKPTKPAPTPPAAPRVDPDGIPVAYLRMRNPIMLDVPGAPPTNGIAAGGEVSITYYPQRRHHLITWTPRPGSHSQSRKLNIPESWCSWEEMAK